MACKVFDFHCNCRPCTLERLRRIPIDKKELACAQALLETVGKTGWINAHDMAKAIDRANQLLNA